MPRRLAATEKSAMGSLRNSGRDCVWEAIKLHSRAFSSVGNLLVGQNRPAGAGGPPQKLNAIPTKVGRAPSSALMRVQGVRGPEGPAHELNATRSGARAWGRCGWLGGP